MSSWVKPLFKKKLKPQSNQLDFTNKYSKFKDYTIIDTETLYKKENKDLRVFNCSLIVKHADGLHSSIITDPTDCLLFMYRETPIVDIENSIKITTLDFDAHKLIGPIQNIINKAPKGDKEDARFFLFKGLLGISYTDKYTTGLSWLYNTILDPINLDLTKNFPKEKNWTFFEHDGELMAIRYYMPLEIYKVDFKTNRVVLHKKFSWSFSTPYELRGGASPVRKNDKYYLFLHTSVTYKTYVLTLDSTTLTPLEITKNDIFDIPTKYQFVCGAVFNDLTDSWIVSMGLDDLYCCVTTITQTDLDNKLTAIRN